MVRLEGIAAVSLSGLRRHWKLTQPLAPPMPGRRGKQCNTPFTILAKHRSRFNDRASCTAFTRTHIHACKMMPVIRSELMLPGLCRRCHSVTLTAVPPRDSHSLPHPPSLSLPQSTVSRNWGGIDPGFLRGRDAYTSLILNPIWNPRFFTFLIVIHQRPEPCHLG